MEYFRLHAGFEAVHVPYRGNPPMVVDLVAGQVKAGKSSVINAILGEQRAATSVVPMTAEITRYELHPPGNV